MSYLLNKTIGGFLCAVSPTNAPLSALGFGYLPGRVWWCSLEKAGGPYGSSLPRAASARGEGGVRLYGSAASWVPARQRSFLYPAFRPQNDCHQPDRAMDEQPLHLERGMTHDALKRYLESAPS